MGVGGGGEGETGRVIGEAEVVRRRGNEWLRRASGREKGRLGGSEEGKREPQVQCKTGEEEGRQYDQTQWRRRIEWSDCGVGKSQGSANICVVWVYDGRVG